MFDYVIIKETLNKKIIWNSVCVSSQETVNPILVSKFFNKKSTYILKWKGYLKFSNIKDQTSWQIISGIAKKKMT